MGGFGIDWYISYTFYSTWEDCLSLIGRVMLSLWVWTIKIAWPVTYKINLRCVSWIPKSVVGYAKATGTFGTKSLTNSLAFSRKSYLSRWNVNKWNVISSIQCLSLLGKFPRTTQAPFSRWFFIILYYIWFTILHRKHQSHANKTVFLGRLFSLLSTPVRMATYRYCKENLARWSLLFLFFVAQERTPAMSL